MVVIVVGMIVNDTSQFLLHQQFEGNCRKFWWRNLLFIQNFYSFDEMCMSWTWYLAVNFQLSVMGSILMSISLK